MSDKFYDEACKEVDEMLPESPPIWNGIETRPKRDIPFHQKRIIPNGWTYNQLTGCYEKGDRTESKEAVAFYGEEILWR